MPWSERPNKVLATEINFPQKLFFLCLNLCSFTPTKATRENHKFRVHKLDFAASNRKSFLVSFSRSSNLPKLTNLSLFYNHTCHRHKFPGQTKLLVIFMFVYVWLYLITVSLIYRLISFTSCDVNSSSSLTSFLFDERTFLCGKICWHKK